MTTTPHHQTHGLSGRQQRILRFVVEQFINSGAPVGSRALSRLKDEHLSPASIRNTMSDLEEMGLLFQPHTSAGRVPTDQGYRFYVDQLTPEQPLQAEEIQQIRAYFANIHGMLGAVLENTSRLLSSFSHYIGIASAPRFESMVFEHIHFVRQGPGRVLVIFVARTGIVHNKLITVEGDITQDLLNKAGAWMMDHFRGLPLARVKERIEAMLRQERARYDLLMRQALLIGRKGLSDDFGGEGVYIEGAPNLMREPDFARRAQVEQLLEAIERKNVLVKLLGGCLEKDGVQVVIGGESELREISGCSLVAAAYNFPDGSRGSVAVLGPTRMRYPRTIFLVDYISRQISKFGA